MDELVKDILNYSQLGKDELKLEGIDVGKLVLDITATYLALHPSCADIQVSPNLPRVLASEAALTQIVSNLLGNAVKFVAPGVRPQVRIHGQESGGMVRLWFEDNGIGIPKHAQVRLFQLFTRLNRPED